MSESLKECETEKITRTHYVAEGKWKCSKDGEEIIWASLVEKRLADASADPKGYVETEHRAAREVAAGEIEKHIGGH